MILTFTYELRMLPESPADQSKVESILSKLMEQFDHCKPLETCYFMRIVPELVQPLYDQLQEIATTLHDSAIADFHFVMTPVDFDDPNFQYQFLKNQSACVRALFGIGIQEAIVDETPENE